MRQWIPCAVVASALLLVAAVAPQDQDLQARVAKLEEQNIKLQRQREELDQRCAKLEKWTDGLRGRGSDMATALARVESDGFTKAACSSASRERLLNTLQQLGTALAAR